MSEVAASSRAVFKEIGKSTLRRLGFEAHRIQPPGSTLRPIGSLSRILEDVRARGFVPRLVFDAGASDGVWTRAARTVFPEAQFVLVEPRPSIQSALADYVHQASGISVVNAAVGSSAGTATLTDWDTGSTLLPVQAGDAPQLTVPVTTLNDLVTKYGRPDLVKLDVEGFELEALKGASALWGVTELFIVEVALFQFEVRPLLHDIVAFMAERGYLTYDIGGPIRRPADGALGLLDVCFARQNGLLRRSETWF